MKKCPKCNLKVSDKTKKCPFCDTKIPKLKDNIGPLPELIETPNKITELETLDDCCDKKSVKKSPLKIKPIKNNTLEKISIFKKKLKNLTKQK